MSEVRKKIESELLEGTWEMLAEHYSRDAVIVVSEKLSILDVAEAVVRDDIGQLKEWLKSISVFKPSSEQIEPWVSGEQKFLCSIVQPYVLIQLTTDSDSEMRH